MFPNLSDSKKPPVNFREFKAKNALKKYTKINRQNCLLVPQAYGVFAENQVLTSQKITYIGTDGMGNCMAVYFYAQGKVNGCYFAHYDETAVDSEIIKYHIQLFKYLFKAETITVNICYHSPQSKLAEKLKLFSSSVKGITVSLEKIDCFAYCVAISNYKGSEAVCDDDTSRSKELFNRCQIVSLIYRLRRGEKDPATYYNAP